MSVRRDLAVVLAGTAALSGCLAGCGDRITASKTWVLQTQDVLTGARFHTMTETITGGDGPGTSFYERCVFPFRNGPAEGPCVLVFNAGHKVYAASGTGTLGGLGTFRSLDRAGSGGSLVVKVVGEEPESQFELVAQPG